MRRPEIEVPTTSLRSFAYDDLHFHGHILADGIAAAAADDRRHSRPQTGAAFRAQPRPKLLTVRRLLEALARNRDRR